MRFVIINLFLVCLLLLGISYLAFGDTVCETNPNFDTHPPVQYVNVMPYGVSTVSLKSF